jgi:hypothetical protein
MADSVEEQEGEIQRAQKPRNKYKTATIILAITLGVIIVVLAGYLIWSKSKNNKTETSASPTPIASVTVSVVKSVVATPDPTTGWKTYTSSDFGLSFKYPNTWNDPTSTINKKEDEGLIPVDYTGLNFLKDGDTSGFRTAELSFVSSYQGTSLAVNAQTLLDVYSSKDASGVGKLWLPSENAAIMAANTPKYIQTVDGKYRGVYYFATIGQDYSTSLDLILIMTDGSNNIVQFQSSSNSDKSGDYSCISSGQSCSDDQLQSQFNSFKDYVQGIDDSSTETIVKNFNSTYKYVAQSLKSL